MKPAPFQTKPKKTLDCSITIRPSVPKSISQVGKGAPMPSKPFLGPQRSGWTRCWLGLTEPIPTGQARLLWTPNKLERQKESPFCLFFRLRYDRSTQTERALFGAACRIRSSAARPTNRRPYSDRSCQTAPRRCSSRTNLLPAPIPFAISAQDKESSLF
jgi:hypothetical protein